MIALRILSTSLQDNDWANYPSKSVFRRYSGWMARSGYFDLHRRRVPRV